MAKTQKTRKKPTKKPAKKSAKKHAKKSPPPTQAALQKHARKVMTDILVHVLTTSALRAKSGISLKGKQEVSIGCDIDFLTAAQMKKVNQKFRKKNSATDVLSFPSPEVFRKAGMLGEILICTPVLAAQARELGHTWKDELRVLMVHGILHLLDFDHERGPQHASLMRKWEEKLLQAPGLIGRLKR